MKGIDTNTIVIKTYFSDKMYTHVEEKRKQLLFRIFDISFFQGKGTKDLFFVTTLRDKTTDFKNVQTNKIMSEIDARTVGVFDKIDTAEYMVSNNVADINETIYPYAIIDHYNEEDYVGRIWYVFKNDKYELINPNDIPENLLNLKIFNKYHDNEHNIGYIVEELKMGLYPESINCHFFNMRDEQIDRPEDLERIGKFSIE